MSKSTSSELWKLNKGLHQSKERLIKKTPKPKNWMLWDVLTYSTPSPTQLHSSLENQEPAITENESGSHRKGQNRVEMTSIGHSQRTVSISPVWWSPRRLHSFTRRSLFDLTQGLPSANNLFPRGIC